MSVFQLHALLSPLSSPGQLFVKHVYIHLGIVVRVRLFEWWRAEAEAGLVADQNEMYASTLLSMNDDPETAGDDFPRCFLARFYTFGLS